MKIIIENTTYTKIKGLKFDPEADISSTSIPVNQFVADLYTEDDISVGVYAYLYDDSDNLWAKYWIIKSERMDKTVLRIEAQSILMLLDRFTLPAKMYSSTSISTAISEVFSTIQAVYPTTDLYTIDNAFTSYTISGYASEQTARERLQWLCFIIGAYVRTYFTETVDITGIDDSLEPIPMNKTYWKPSISYSDYVTAVKVKAYTYTQGTPQTTDKWVEVNGTYYIQEERDFTLTNPDVPVTATENIIEIKDVTIINVDNADEILTRLSTYYFQRIEVDAEIINNGEYIVGERYTINIDSDTLISGYMKSASFTFGLQAKSKITLIQTETIQGVKLTVIYMYGNVKLGQNIYYLPVAYNYSIENPFIDYSMDNHRYIFYPENDNATGVIGSEDMTDEQEYQSAIDFDNSSRIARLYNVDQLSYNQDSEVLTIK